MAKVIEIGPVESYGRDRLVGDGRPCYIVAEIGQNHNGDAYTALRLITQAANAGCDAVKMCKRHIPSDLTAAARAKPYEGPQSFGATYGEHRQALELPISDYKHLKDRIHYNEWPLVLFSTVCDLRSLEEMEEHVNPPLYKIASRDLDNLPLIEAVAKTYKPVILSTGFARSDHDVANALDVVRSHHLNVVLLYCVSLYPAPDEAVCFRQMEHYRDTFDVLVGFSDHTVGIHLAQTAVTLGACVVEKHITLARAMKGTDHAASLEPEGLRKFVRNIRGSERACNLSMCYATSPTPPVLAERERNYEKLGRSLTSRGWIRAGAVLVEADVCLKSPGSGIQWSDREKAFGRRVREHIRPDSTICWGHLEGSGEADGRLQGSGISAEQS